MKQGTTKGYANYRKGGENFGSSTLKKPLFQPFVLNEHKNKDNVSKLEQLNPKSTIHSLSRLNSSTNS